MLKRSAIAVAHEKEKRLDSIPEAHMPRHTAFKKPCPVWLRQPHNPLKVKHNGVVEKIGNFLEGASLHG